MSHQSTNNPLSSLMHDAVTQDNDSDNDNCNKKNVAYSVYDEIFRQSREINQQRNMMLNQQLINGCNTQFHNIFMMRLYANHDEILRESRVLKDVINGCYTQLHNNFYNTINNNNHVNVPMDAFGHGFVQLPDNTVMHNDPRQYQPQPSLNTTFGVMPPPPTTETQFAFAADTYNDNIIDGNHNPWGPGFTMHQ